MGIFSWLSDRFGEGDRSRNSDDHREQSSTPIGSDHSSAPLGEQPPAPPAAEPASSEEESKAPTFTDFTVRPVTIERLGLLFDSFGWKWALDDDGDIASRWNRHNFYFRMVGAQRDVLSIVGFLEGDAA